MGDLVCGHKSGMLGSAGVLKESVAKLVGKEEWANNSICNKCMDQVKELSRQVADKLLTLSVPVLDGYKIERYIGLVTGQSVIGTGPISEFISGFDDFFGGSSGTFSKKILQGETASIRMMKQKAVSQGANAIIGVDIDYGELTSNKGMIMVVATGTAVVIDERE